jgi:hypothetical protein
MSDYTLIQTVNRRLYSNPSRQHDYNSNPNHQPVGLLLQSHWKCFLNFFYLMARKRKSPSSESDVSLHSEDENTTPTLENNQKESVEEAAKALGRNANTRKTGISKHECSGHIESIELVDFMCHRHLLVAFKPQINFVIGNNGSGKSAILTALTVCLGGRASATQRATSVVSLIREGAQSGKVKVKLNNQGDNPYMPEKYGDHITIERSFRREGSNAYSIYDENDRFVIGRREEIISICDHFSIQVDNPLAVLTQETAKKFLANSKPKELYEVTSCDIA